MYRSLYSVLKSVIDSKSTGVLNIVHYSNDHGMIYLSSGAIVRIKTNQLQGTQAAERIFSWVSFLAQFKEKKLKVTANSKKVEQTKKIMAYLAKIDKRVVKIINTIEGCETVFDLTQSGTDNENNFTSEEQSIASVMDGSKTIIEILIKAKVPELKVLLILLSFLEKGFAEVVKFHDPTTNDESNRFFAVLIETLSGITGPVAELLVDEVCDAMGITQEDLCKSDIGPLLNFIREKLDKDEQDALNSQEIVDQAFQE
ncbi:MAG: hypothetical protein K8R67_11215 [Desulfobacteraceae bacterium]|nr:hypothetical protein [Desulfobacteraceae bacterium]